MLKTFSPNQKKVLLGACLFQCALIGVLINSTGILLTQIRSELGFSVTRISSYYMVRSAVGAAGSALFSRLFYRSNKARFMCGQLVIMVAGYLLLLLGPNTWLWYLSAALLGFYGVASTIMVPCILGDWFLEDIGFASGIAFAFSGIGGAIFNPIMSFLINGIRWQGAIVVLGTTMLLLGVSGVYFMFSGEKASVSMSQHKSASLPLSTTPHFNRTFWLSVGVMLAGACSVQFVQYIGIYAQGIGHSLNTSAALTSLVMVGNIVGKLMFGTASDKLGVWRTTLLALCCVLLATTGYLFAGNVLIILFASSLLYGVSYALSSIGISHCCLQAYGKDEAKTYVGIHMSICSMSSIAFLLAIGILYDSFQNFTVVLWLIIGLLSISIIATVIFQKSGQY